MTLDDSGRADSPNAGSRHAESRQADSAHGDSVRTVSRRSVLLGGVALAAAAGLGTGRASAGSWRPRASAGRDVGPYRVTPVFDTSGAFFAAAGEVFSGATEDDWRRARDLDPEAFGPDDTWLLDFRAYLVQGPGDHTVLVDTGVGPVGSPATAWAPVPGQLESSLAAAGVRADDVHVVVLTHLHEDHYGGSVRLDGTPTFPNARYVVQDRDVAGLTDGDPATAYVLDPLRATGQLQVVDGDRRLGRPGSPGAGLGLILTPGHTAGHQSMLVDGGRRCVVLAGDVLVHAVQLVDPDVAYAFESFPDQARTSRHALLRLARRRGADLGTAHLHAPFVRAG